MQWILPEHSLLPPTRIFKLGRHLATYPSPQCLSPNPSWYSCSPILPPSLPLPPLLGWRSCGEGCFPCRCMGAQRGHQGLSSHLLSLSPLSPSGRRSCGEGCCACGCMGAQGGCQGCLGAVSVCIAGSRQGTREGEEGEAINGGQPGRGTPTSRGCCSTHYWRPPRRRSGRRI